MDNEDKKLAVLIDADNVSHAHVKDLMEEIARYGTPTFKRIYGDWTRPALAGWKKVLLDFAITPVQQYSYTKGKNATDSALIIDAMDILYTGGVDGFCLVSSDSDFTRLATRLREDGKTVIGIGAKKTPSAFIAGCNKFIFLEILGKETPPAGVKPAEPARRRAPRKSAVNQQLARMMHDGVRDLEGEEEWVSLGELGSLLVKKHPAFDPRNYGFQKLLDLIRGIPGLEIDARPTARKNVIHYYVRIK